MSKIIGIDLGTTNSCVAVMEGGEPVVIANAEGNRTTPSVVAFSKTGERMVGQVAKRQAVTNHDRTVASIKRRMGSDYKVDIDGKKYTPQEISAMILQKLKADAEAYLGDVYKRQVHRRAERDDDVGNIRGDAGFLRNLHVGRDRCDRRAGAETHGSWAEQLGEHDFRGPPAAAEAGVDRGEDAHCLLYTSGSWPAAIRRLARARCRTGL